MAMVGIYGIGEEGYEKAKTFPQNLLIKFNIFI
jgi:hypothetical protein